MLHFGLGFDVAGGPFFRNAGFESGETLRFKLLHLLRLTRVRVNANTVAGGAAQQFIDGHAERLAFDVPKRLIDAAESAGENGAAAIKSVPVNGLPMFSNRARVFADKIWLDLLHCFRAGEGAAFGDGFAQAGNPGVGVDLEKEPAGFHQKGFQFGDF